MEVDSEFIECDRVDSVVATVITLRIALLLPFPIKWNKLFIQFYLVISLLSLSLSLYQCLRIHYCEFDAMFSLPIPIAATSIGIVDAFWWKCTIEGQSNARDNKLYDASVRVYPRRSNIFVMYDCCAEQTLEARAQSRKIAIETWLHRNMNWIYRILACLIWICKFSIRLSVSTRPSSASVRH